MIGFLVNRRHNRLRDLLSAYIDGRVSEPETGQVEHHLAGCDECRLELDALRATVGLLRNLPELEAPRSFALTEAPASISPTPFVAWTPRIATVAASLLLAVLLVGDALGIVSQSAPAEEIVAPMASSITAPEAAIPAAAAPAPVAAMAATAPPSEAAVEDQAVAVTPEREPEVERQAAAAAEGSAPAAAAPAPAAPPDATAEERAVAVPPETEEEVAIAAEESAPPVAIAEAPVASTAAEESDGFELPLWQLEVAAGGLAAVLALAMFFLARRGRRPVPR